MVRLLLRQARRPRIRHRNPDLPAASAALPASPIVPAPFFRWKGYFDRLAALVLLIPGLPLMLVLVVLVRLTSRGPGIYKQCRVGLNGRHFCMYKIRTMRQDAEAATGPVWTQAGDPRVTPIGRFLRAFHLDELPQLFNVLKGQMALVGPRPERPEFVAVLSESIAHYRDRIAVRPGVTGVAQLNLPPDSDLDSVRRKVDLDRQYIQEANWWMDLRILLCTALRFTKLPLLGLFGLYRAPSCSERPLAVARRPHVQAPQTVSVGPPSARPRPNCPPIANGKTKPR